MSEAGYASPRLNDPMRPASAPKPMASGTAGRIATFAGSAMSESVPIL